MNLYLKALTLLSILFISSLKASPLKEINIGTRIITYEEKNGYAIVEGDILLGSLKELQQKGAIITPKLEGTHWPHGIIPYELDEELPLKNKLSVYQAIDHWQQHTPLKFIELTSKNRAEFNDSIIFEPASGTTCSSYVGRKMGKQKILLSTRCTTMNTVHEVGHALGLWHEQSRGDRDFFVHIAWENIEEQSKFNFNQHLNNGTDYKEYDYESIMHYGPYAFSKNGHPTIIPLMEGVEIGQRIGLSEKDIAVIKAMYFDE